VEVVAPFVDDVVDAGVVADGLLVAAHQFAEAVGRQTRVVGDRPGQVRVERGQGIALLAHGVEL